METATNRAAEAIEAAEMGAILDLSTTAKLALITTIAAAIEVAVVEEQERLSCAQ